MWNLTCLLCGEKGVDLVLLQEHAINCHSVKQIDHRFTTRIIIEPDKHFQWVLPDGRLWLDALEIGSPEELIIHGHIVTMQQLFKKPLTTERLELTYQKGGPVLAPFQRVYSVGINPICAIEALGKKIGWGPLGGYKEESVNEGEWYYRFHADGTSMKAAGRFVPGGAIVDWWK